MLTIRLGDIINEIDDLSEAGHISGATAQTKDDNGSDGVPEAKGTKSSPSLNEEINAEAQEAGNSELVQDSVKKIQNSVDKKKTKQAQSIGPVSQRVIASVSQDPNKLNLNDPTFLTPNEIQLLQRLAERRDKLEKREQELNVREGLMQAAEVRIDNQISELKKLEKLISSRLQTFDEQQLRKLENLVKIYESMKPKDAAKIFEELEMDTLLEVAARMKSKKLAPVMAKMDPDKAREMTIELRVLGELPAFSGDLGG